MLERDPGPSISSHICTEEERYHKISIAHSKHPLYPPYHHPTRDQEPYRLLPAPKRTKRIAFHRTTCILSCIFCLHLTPGFWSCLSESRQRLLSFSLLVSSPQESRSGSKASGIRGPAVRTSSVHIHWARVVHTVISSVYQSIMDCPFSQGHGSLNSPCDIDVAQHIGLAYQRIWGEYTTTVVLLAFHHCT